VAAAGVAGGVVTAQWQNSRIRTPHGPASTLKTPAKAMSIWTFQADGPVYSDPVVAADIVYVAGARHLYALHDDGTKAWSFPAAASKPVVASDTVYILDGLAKSVCALRASNGTMIWTSKISGDGNLAGPPAVDSNMNYIGFQY
jgi:outer membrane protein assembly factor BamB